MASVASVKREACFGCTGCMAICKLGAIDMQADDEGFMIPVINERKCVECGACLQVCPALQPWQGRGEKNIFYAFQHSDDKVLAKSTSGGAFSAIVDSVELPYVCGCVLDENLYVKHIVSQDKTIIAAMRGSKYVQSDIGNCLRQIGERLLAGENVIFTGTSCQVHGLCNYLAAARVPVENLLTIDLICHGVPSNLMHQEYVKNYEADKGGKVIKHYFRTKRQNWGMRFILKNYEQTVVRNSLADDRTSLASQLWVNVFFSELCLRESCYRCPYCTDNKPADITMSDFWGIEETDVDLEFKKGCSLLIARGKGGDIAARLSNYKLLNAKQESVARKYQSHLKRPAKRPASRDDFWYDYHKYGFAYVARKYLRYSYRYKLLLLMYNMAVRLKAKKISQYIRKKIFF